MKVILRQNYEPLGQVGDVVDVKDGYANNFLLPRKIAYIALNGNLRALEEEKKAV
jgi:large subunit ribosomal protein L9